jgi:hypothetical protein
MNHSKKPGMSFSLGTNHLHGVARFDQIRNDTLIQLVQSWAEPKARDEILDALDELAAVVCGPRGEGELDAAIEQVEDASGMDTAQIEVSSSDARRLLDELTEVTRRLSRFNPKRLLSSQRREGGAAA